MKRVLLVILGLLLICTVTPVLAVDLEAPVNYWVPDHYDTIQDAINDAPIGSVIGLRNDIETTPITINFHRSMVIRGQGTGGVTTVLFSNTVGDDDYVIDITADHSGLQNLIIEEAFFGTEAGIRVEADFCAINEVEMHGFDERGIWAVGSSDLEISYCYLDMNGPLADAIILSTCPNAHIIGNTIMSSLSKGIDINFSDDVTIEQNDISNCYDDGIYAYFSHRLIVKDNDVTTSGGGITLSWCLDGLVRDNVFDQNSNHGISLWNGASDNMIKNNIITNTFGTNGAMDWGNGITIDDSTEPSMNNIIKRNQIEGNYIGVYAKKPEANYIYLNNIVGNDDYAQGYLNQYGSQTPVQYEYGGTEYTNTLGNYWSEYTGVDTTPMDGIGDTVFEDASSNVWDYNPLISMEVNYIELGDDPTEEFILHLTTGWNIVSIPVLPTMHTPDDIFGALPYYMIYSWSGTDYIIPVSVEPGHGYWVLVLADADVTITGEPVTTVIRTLTDGWSLIGGTNQVTTTTDTGPFSVHRYTGSGYETVTQYQPGEGYWGLMLAPGDFSTPQV